MPYRKKEIILQGTFPLRGKENKEEYNLRIIMYQCWLRKQKGKK